MKRIVIYEELNKKVNTGKYVDRIIFCKISHLESSLHALQGHNFSSEDELVVALTFEEREKYSNNLEIILEDIQRRRDRALFTKTEGTQFEESVNTKAMQAVAKQDKEERIPVCFAVAFSGKFDPANGYTVGLKSNRIELIVQGKTIKEVIANFVELSAPFTARRDEEGRNTTQYHFDFKGLQDEHFFSKEEADAIALNKSNVSLER